MKKSLFALAALSAFAGAAQAQSSVTVYGVMDLGYIGSNSRDNVTKIQKSAIGQGAETTSRLGFRGTEDLGGGMRAFFTVELGLTPQNSELSGGTAADSVQRTTNGSGSAVDNRQSFVGIGKKGMGEISFGRQYTPVFVAGAATSVGQYNNIIGDVLYSGASSVFSSASTATSGNNNGQGFTNRASNSVQIKTDRLAGLVLSGMYAFNNQDQTQTGSNTTGGAGFSSTGGSLGGNTNWNMWGIGGDFRWQKLIVTAAYQSFNTTYTNAVPAANTIVNLNSPAATSGQLIAVTGSGSSTTLAIHPASNIDDKQTIVGAVYDFGILKAYAGWVGRKVNNNVAIAANTASGVASAVAVGEQVNRTAQQIGVRGNITPTVEYWASVGNGKIKANVGAATANFTGYQLGSNYILSKRTNLYAIFGNSSTSSTSGSLGGVNANQYALGVRHTF